MRGTIVMLVLRLLVLQQMVYSSSVDIRPEWAVVEQIPFTALAKLHYRCICPHRMLSLHVLLSAVLGISLGVLLGSARRRCAQLNRNLWGRGQSQ